MNLRTKTNAGKLLHWHSSWSTVTIVVISLLAFAFRLWIAAHQPLIVEAVLNLDDANFAREAHELLSGSWLGVYESRTLIKNPSYAFLLCLPTLLHLPYGVVFMLFQGFGALAFSLAIRPVVKNQWLLLIVFLSLVYMPVLFTYSYFQRIYRLGIVIPFILMVFSCYLALWFRRETKPTKLLAWSVVLAVSFPIFYYIKEDSSWSLPFVVVVSVILSAVWIVQGIREKQITTMCGKLGLLVLPFASLFVVSTILSAQNSNYYGTSVICERTEGNFARFYHNLLSIDAKETDVDVWVSQSALQRAYEVSPTLKEREEHISQYWKAWANLGHVEGHRENEMPKDLGVWALRQACENWGGYASSQDSESFWGQASRELEVAFDAGKLSRKQGLWVSSIAQPVPASQIPRLLSEIPKTSLVLASMKDAVVYEAGGSGNPDEQASMRLLLMQNSDIDSEERANALARAFVLLGQLISLPVAFLSIFACVWLVLDLLIQRSVRDLEVTLSILGLALSVVVVLVGVWWTLEYEQLIGEAFYIQVFGYSAAFYPLTYMLNLLVITYTIEDLTQKPAAPQKSNDTSH